MRTNIVIDDAIMQAAMQAGEFKTKREAVEEGLRLLARRKVYSEMLKFKGKIIWDDQPSKEVLQGKSQVNNKDRPRSIKSSAGSKTAKMKVAA